MLKAGTCTEYSQRLMRVPKFATNWKEVEYMNNNVHIFSSEVHNKPQLVLKIR